MELLLSLDGGALLWLQTFVRCAVLDPVMVFYTQMGDLGLLWIILSLGLLCFRKTRHAGVLALCALALGTLCTNVVLKHLVGRARPWLTVPGLVAIVAEHDPNSFPSGHTCAAFAAAGAWCRTLPWRWMQITGLVLAALMGFSRLYVGVHFPSDVLVGALVGLLCSQVVWWVDRSLARRRGAL